jgi:hypothetical protein
MLISRSFILIIHILKQTPFCFRISLIPYANNMHPWGGGDIHIDLQHVRLRLHLLSQNNHGAKGSGATRIKQASLTIFKYKCTVTFDTKIKIYFQQVGFEVLTPVVMKSTVFWDITMCSPLKVNRRFGGTYRLHLQGRRIIQAR